MSSVGKPLDQFWRGFLSVPRGYFWLFTHKELRKYIWVSLLIVILSFAVAMGFAFYFLPKWIMLWLPTGDPAESILFWLLFAFSYVLLAALLILCFVFFASAWLTPVLSALSEKTLKLVDRPVQPLNFSLFFSSIKKMFIFTFIGIVLFVSSLIPGVGFLSLLIGFILIAADLWDYSLEHLGQHWPQRKTFFLNHKMALFGCALNLLVSSLIPFWQLVFLPAAVVGVTLFVHESLPKNESQI